MENDFVDVYAALLDVLEEVSREVQPRRGGGDASVCSCVHRFVALLVSAFRAARDVGWQGHGTVLVHQLPPIEPGETHPAQAAADDPGYLQLRGVVKTNGASDL